MADQAFQALYRGNAHSLDYTNGATAINPGEVVVVGNIAGVAKMYIPPYAVGAVDVAGLYDVVKDASVFADGQEVFWNPAGNPVGGTGGSGAASASPAGAVFMGYACEAQLTGDVIVRVKLWQGTPAGAAGGAGDVSDAIADPGNAGAIPVTDSGYVPIVTAGAETRTLAAPLFVGEQLLLSLAVHGGTVVITCATFVNITGNNTITMAAAGDSIMLTAIAVGATVRWRVTYLDGATLSTV
jgi:predicted RecA/RadA family phage recombinase